MDYNPLSPEVIDNPYPYYSYLREHAPVYWIAPLHAWALSRYADVDFALRNPQTFSSSGFTDVIDQIEEGQQSKQMPRTIIDDDGKLPNFRDLRRPTTVNQGTTTSGQPYNNSYCDTELFRRHATAGARRE